MTKPRIAVMVLVTVFVGFVYGAGAGASPWSWPTLAAALVSTALACMGASMLNQVMEFDVDALMRRTKKRPLPAGRVRPLDALAAGLALATTGVVAMAWWTNWLSAVLLALTIASYALLYTPMKRRSSLSTVVGAVPGAAPPVIGFAAADGAIGAEAVVLFAILFLWQLPHFLAIAWLHRRDYARAGLPTLPVLDPDGRSTFRQILLLSMALLPVGMLPALTGMAGDTYLIVAIVAGIGFLACGARLAAGRRRRHARAVFLASLVYLPILLSAMLLDKT
jgi:protoheme IX farnesyltransferase